MTDQQGHAPCSIATGLDLAAIGIEYPHCQISVFGWLKQDHLIAAYSGSPVSKSARQSIRHGDGLLPCIDDDKIIAEAVHLVKGQFLRRRAHGARFRVGKGRCPLMHPFCFQ